MFDSTINKNISASIGILCRVSKILLRQPLLFLIILRYVNPFDLENHRRVPSLQQAIIIRLSFVQPFMIEPPCKAV